MRTFALVLGWIVFEWVSVGVLAGSLPVSGSVVSGQLPVGVLAAGSRLLWVSAARGYDAAAVRGSRLHAWKTIYDIYDTNGPASYGAATAARPGDWIIVEPGTYYVPAIPLNLPGRQFRGVNLLVSRGATLIRTDFSNTNLSVLPANLEACGPLIVPGNRSIIHVEGTVIATNAEIYDGILGWASTHALYQPRRSAMYGFWNWPATNVMLRGKGLLSGLSDVIYISSVPPSGVGSITCRGLRLQSHWDCWYSAGTNRIRTVGLDIVSGVDNPNSSSHGVLIQTWGYWTDIRSGITASGAVESGLPGDRNASVYLANGVRARLVGTHLRILGQTNVMPLFVTNSVISGHYWVHTNGLPGILVRL